MLFSKISSLKIELLLVGLHKQVAKTHSLFNNTHSTRNGGLLFDEHLTFSGKISSQVRLYTSIVHSKFEYSNSVYYNSVKPFYTSMPEACYFKSNI